MAVKRRRSQHLLARDAAAAVDVERGEGGTQLRLGRLFTGAGVKGRAFCCVTVLVVLSVLGARLGASDATSPSSSS